MNLVQGFRIQDLFDILIIALLLYGFLIWMTRTASRFVLWGVGLLGLVYLLSRAFDLYLTAVVLQGFFAVLILALVVIFQEDLRRFFEGLATWGRRGKNSLEEEDVREMEIISSIAASLASRKVGALMVIVGGEPLDRHLEGGVILGGTLSEPLLESLFDPHSIGHDGAVIIQDGKVLRFGCHLPLSPHSKKFGLSGLRHTAALGLAERSDAICVVVSEEKGTISVARDGAIHRLENPNELHEILQSVYANMGPGGPRQSVSGWMKKNTGQKALALALSMILWTAFGHQKDIIRREFVFPIEYRNLSERWVIEASSATQAQVTLKGPEQAFRLLDPATLTVSVDLTNVTEGAQEVVLSSRLVKIPANLSVASVRPPSITLTAQKLLPVEVPVEVQVQGSLSPGLTLLGITVVPARVTLWAAPGVSDIKIQTSPVDLRKITQTTSLTPRLQFPAGVRFLEGQPPAVQVTLRVQPVEPPKPPPAVLEAPPVDAQAPPNPA